MVEWKTLGQIGRFENIGTDKKIIEGEKLVTLLNYVDVYHNKYIDASVPQMQVSASDKKIKDCSVEQGDIFVTPTSETVDDIGHSSVITNTLLNTVYSYHIMRYRLFEKNMLLSYYINYSFDTDNVKKQILKKAQGLTRFGLSKDKFSSILIPIPSQEEQERIVGILDTFTASIDNLKKQIAQRRKQYEFYRDQLLDLEGKEGVEWKKLGELCCIRTGKLNANAQVQNGQYPFFTCDAKPFTIDKYAFDTEAIMISGNGSQVGHINYYKGKFNAYQRTYVIDRFNNINVFYLLHYLKGTMRSYVMEKSKKGSVPYITLPMLENFCLPIPSLSEQNRIVSILDTFTASISNLEAQLKQRQKQYEYYRNQLLTFE